ncbi:MAG: 3-oxoacyl-[acyl-carrier-protein] synthase 2 [Phycisphaerae bacterium]|nr:3-oxoacyl-[acyl-carrier-protein] synthase 2 [Phycisphaerae bacterium]
MQRNRVVITGMGWVTPLGADVQRVWQRMLQGESGVRPTEIFDAATFPTSFSAQVQGFQLIDFLGAEAERHADVSRNAGFALAAARMAWDQSGLSRLTTLERERVGVYLGSGEGPVDFDNLHRCAFFGWDHAQGHLDTQRWAEQAYRGFQQMREHQQDPNMAGAHIACLFDAQGPNFDTLTACAASTQAIGEACQWIRRGEVEVMISGGAHSMIHPLGVTGFNRLTALSTRNNDPTRASRPFDRERDGFVLGEGAGILILESLEHALIRGAKIHAEIIGYGSTADAFRVTDIHEDARGSSAAMRLAIQDAGLTIHDIDYINAHGTGTKENDELESLAIKKVFGDHAKKVPVSSIKSMMGHLVAAAGAVELMTCVLAIRDQILPPTINLTTPDPACDLDYVPNQARPAKVRTALSNSFGFGGQNDTLIIRQFEG